MMIKRIILIFVLMLFVVTVGDEHPMLTKKEDNIEFKMYSQFPLAYKRLRLFEGNYANSKNDKGGETYGGVTRNFNPEWYGWKYIDAHKKQFKVLKQHHYIPEAEFWVQDYFLDLWVDEEFYLIKDQDVANYAFDLRVNSNFYGVRIIQETLIKMGQKIAVTYVMDKATIDAINNVRPDQFLHKVKLGRIKWYNTIVKMYPKQKCFYNTWVYRANTIKDL